MDSKTIVAIASAALNGGLQALAAWPVLSDIVLTGRDPTDAEQATLDAAADAAHAALQAD